MANRRMFAKSVVSKDTFIEMPHSTQLLYFHLGMNADDDGFVDNYRSIMRNIGCNEDNLKLLVVKGFVIWFENRLVIIRHWKVHNQIQKDRYKPTQYIVEKSLLTTSKSGVYSLETKCIQDVYNLETQYSIGKDSILLNNIESPIYPRVDNTDAPATIPTIDELKTFCDQQGIKIDVQRFYNYYASRGWLLDGAPVKDWQALVRCWNTREHDKRNNQTTKPTTTDDDGNGGTVL